MTGDRLLAYTAEIADLRRIYQLLSWDQAVTMPPAATEARGHQMALLARTRHSLLTSDQLSELLDEARTSDDEIILEVVSVLDADRARASAVDGDLLAEMVRSRVHGWTAWANAWEAADFALAAPALRRRVELMREYAACFPHLSQPYDALLDIAMRGLSLDEVMPVLSQLRTGIPELLPTALETSRTRAPRIRISRAARKRFIVAVLEAIGLDTNRWRYDETSTALAIGVCTNDVRVVADHRERGLDTFYCALHEFGHGLYEASFDPRYDRTTLDAPADAAIHESQSRFWENLIGRSAAFWRWAYPLLREHAPGACAGLDAADFFGAVNTIRPSLSRVNADELTYGLHIDIRVQLELELFSGGLTVDELPAAWDDLYREQLGIQPKNARDGVLQDVHWWVNDFGYFASYSLGNVIAGQLLRRLEHEIPNLNEMIMGGKFDAIVEWLRIHVHAPGRSIAPHVLRAQIVGGALDATPFLNYLQAKIGALHNR